MYPHITIKSQYSIGEGFQGQSAQISPGDSGGPLINSNNEIIGVASTFTYFDIIDHETNIVIGYDYHSSFTPLHRETSKEILQKAIEAGSNFQFKKKNRLFKFITNFFEK